MKRKDEEEYEDDHLDDNWGEGYEDDIGKPLKEKLSQCHKLEMGWLKIP